MDSNTKEKRPTLREHRRGIWLGCLDNVLSTIIVLIVFSIVFYFLSKYYWTDMDMSDVAVIIKNILFYGSFLSIMFFVTSSALMITFVLMDKIQAYFITGAAWLGIGLGLFLADILPI